jgi:TolB-like protein
VVKVERSRELRVRLPLLLSREMAYRDYGEEVDRMESACCNRSADTSLSYLSLGVLAVLTISGCASQSEKPDSRRSVERGEAKAQLQTARQPREPTWSGSLESLTNQLEASSKFVTSPDVAVIEFVDVSGNPSPIGRFLAEELSTSLFKTGKFGVIERTMLDRLYAEHRLTETGVIDSRSAKDIGKILGAEGIVTGTIVRIDHSLRVNARLIATETGSVVAVAASTFPDLQGLNAAEPSRSAQPSRVSPREPPRITELRSNNSRKVMEGGALRQGRLFYSDRKYTIGFIPQKYQGLQYIRTACNSKRDSENTAISFKVDQRVWLYLAWDERVPPQSWLRAGFRKTGESLRMSSQKTRYEIYKSNRPSESGEMIRILGQSPSNHSFYLVFMEPASST